MDFSLFSLVRQSIRSLCQAVKQFFRRWTKPNDDALVLNTALDLTRSITELVIENALLRQQLIVLKRHTKRPALSWRDRCAGRKPHPFEICGQSPRSVVEPKSPNPNLDNLEPVWCRVVADLPIRSRISTDRVELRVSDRTRATSRSSG